MDSYLNEFISNMMENQVYRDGISDVGLPMRICLYAFLFPVALWGITKGLVVLW